MFLGEWRFFCFLTFIVQFSNSQNDTTYVSFQSITQNVTISTPYHITDTAPNITEVNANHAGTKETSKITYEASTLQPTLQNSIDALTEKQTHLTHAWTEKQTHPTVVPQTLIMAQTSAKYPATNTPPTGSGKILTALYTRTYLNDITSERSSTNRKKQSTTQFTQTSTDKEVDQSTKIPVSKSIDDSVTSPKRVVTTCAKPDAKIGDGEGDGESGPMDRTIVTVLAALGVWLIVIVICCVLLIIKKRKKDEYLPSNASQALRARGILPPHAVALPCFDEYKYEYDGDQGEAGDSAFGECDTDSDNISPLPSKSFHRDAGYSSFLTKKQKEPQVSVTDTITPTTSVTTQSESAPHPAGTPLVNTGTENLMNGDMDGNESVDTSRASRRHFSDPDVVLRQSFFSGPEEQGQQVLQFPQKRPKSVQVTSI